MKKNLRTIIFAGAISTVGALGIAGTVAIPVASAAVISHSAGSRDFERSDYRHDVAHGASTDPAYREQRRGHQIPT